MRASALSRPRLTIRVRERTPHRHRGTPARRSCATVVLGILYACPVCSPSASTRRSHSAMPQDPRTNTIEPVPRRTAFSLLFRKRQAQVRS
jgi:hypothetical protein